MSVPQLQILDAVGNRLALIKTSNGYSCSIAKIKRATLKSFTDDDLPMVNYWPETDDLVLKGHGWIDRSLSIVIEFYDRTRDRIFTDVAMELANDVAIAMLRSPNAPLVSNNPDINMGGLIKSSQLTTITPQIGEGQSPWCGVILNYLIDYRVSASNPLVMVP